MIIPIIIRMQVITRFVKHDANACERAGITIGLSALFILCVNAIPFIDIMIEINAILNDIVFTLIFPIGVYWATRQTTTSEKVGFVILLGYAGIAMNMGFVALYFELFSYYKLINPFTCRALP